MQQRCWETNLPKSDSRLYTVHGSPHKTGHGQIPSVPVTLTVTTDNLFIKTEDNILSRVSSTTFFTSDNKWDT